MNFMTYKDIKTNYKKRHVFYYSYIRIHKYNDGVVFQLVSYKENCRR